jgi:hypothetical protein
MFQSAVPPQLPQIVLKPQEEKYQTSGNSDGVRREVSRQCGQTHLNNELHEGTQFGSQRKIENEN